MSEGAAAAMGGEGGESAGDAAAVPAAAPNGGEATPITIDNWMDSIDAPELRTYAESRQFESPKQLVERYQNLENLRGVPDDQLLKIPTDGEDADAWAPVWSRLGRPEASDKYQLPDLDEGSEIKIMPEFRELAHKIGLSQDQAKQLAEWYGPTMTKAAESMGEQGAAQRAAQYAKDITELKSEWGDGYDEGDVIANKAITLFVPEGKAAKIAEAIGMKDAMVMFRKIGTAIGEHRSPDNDEPGSGTFAKSTAEAQVEIARLRQDEKFMAARANGEPAAVKRWSDLYDQAYPGGVSS